MTHLEVLEYAVELQKKVDNLEVRIGILPMYLGANDEYRYSYLVAAKSNKEQLHSPLLLSNTIDQNFEVIKDWLKPHFYKISSQSLDLIGKIIYINKDKPYVVEYIPSATHLKLVAVDEPVLVSDCFILV